MLQKGYIPSAVEHKFENEDQMLAQKRKNMEECLVRNMGMEHLVGNIGIEKKYEWWYH